MPLGAARFGLSGADLGKLELITTTTTSNFSTVDFLSIKETEYNVHLMTYTNLGGTAQAQAYKWQFYESGVLESATVYQWAFQYNSTGGFSEQRSTGDSGIRIQNTGSEEMEVNGYTYFYNLADSSKYSFATQQETSVRKNSGGTHTNTYGTFGSGVLPQTSTVDGIRFLCTGASNLTSSATFSLYGIKE